MKELLEEKKQDRVQVVAEQKKQLQYKGSMMLKKGLKVWKCKDGKVSELSENDYIETVVLHSSDGNIKKKRRVRMEKGAYYLQALNMKNALRKFKKWGVIE
jgi:hypothetical protein